MTRERYLSDEELGRFMCAVRERRHVNRDRDYAFFALVGNTGVRPAETLVIVRSDLRLTGKKPTVRLRLRRNTPTGPQPVIELVLNDRVRDVVAAYADTIKDPDALVFPFSKRQAARLFHYYAHKAGIASSFRVYSLRHTVGMRLWRHTRDLRLIQAVMGHVRLKASAAYVHVDVETIRSAHESAGVIT